MDTASGWLTPDLPGTPTLGAPPAAADMSASYALQAKSMEYQTQIATQQTELAEKQAAIAKQMFGAYAKKIAPMSADLAEDALRGTDPAPYEARARNTQMQQLTPALKSTAAGLNAQGVDPSSPKAVAAGKGVASAIGQAAGTAQYQARKKVSDVDHARQLQTYGLGANIPAQTVAGYGTAAGIIGRAGVPVANAYTGLSNAYASQAQGQYALDTQMWNYQNSLIMSDYNQQVALANAQASANGQIFSGLATVATVKAMSACIPEGQTVDVDHGATFIRDVGVGDIITGSDGNPAKVLIVHQYLELPDADKLVPFLKVILADGGEVGACAKHKVDGKPLGEYKVGERIGYTTVKEILPIQNVGRSYDLVTSAPGGGYMMAGVPVASMIEEVFGKRA